jgi:hypothetical protein
VALLLAVAPFLLAGALAEERSVITIQAAGSPVAIDRTTVLTVAGSPPVLLYAATNLTDDELDQFTVMMFVFDAKGILKARHVAPGRHLLPARATKFSAMVLDGAPFDAADVLVVGVNQAQRVGSDTWWRADLRAAADAAVLSKTP